MNGAESVVVHDDVDAALAIGPQDEEILGLLRAAGVGPLLTVPLRVGRELVGAITFVNAEGRSCSREGVQLAEELATRAALALDRARLHAEAIALKKAAESANEAKSAFLGMVSHELRTPFAAIGGYAELIDMGLRGPVTAEQRSDFARIRTNQEPLPRLGRRASTALIARETPIVAGLKNLSTTLDGIPLRAFIPSMEWDVEYTDEFGEWLKGHTHEERASIVPIVGSLEERGPKLRHPYTSGIESSKHSHMRELRIQHEGRPYRLLSALAPRRTAILLIGGDTTGNDRWYDEFVPEADKLYDDHLDTLKKEQDNG
jgi:hypothetical protein